MKGKKFVSKTLLLSMVFSLLSPIILSVGVSAIETKDFVSSNQINSEVKVGDEQSQENMKSTTVTEEALSNGSTKDIKENSEEEVISNPKEESDIETQIEIDGVVDKEIHKESADELSNENNLNERDNELPEPTEEYYFAEETREKAIEMLEEEQKSISTYNMRVNSISETTAFIDAISSYAIAIA